MACSQNLLRAAVLAGSFVAPNLQGIASEVPPVKRIYVGEMGKSDHSERFRLLLAEQLQRSGVTVTDDVQSADAVLSGILTASVVDDDIDAKATVRLKREGVTLWSADVSRGLHRRGSDTVKAVAEKVAKKLKEYLGKSR